MIGVDAHRLNAPDHHIGIGQPPKAEPSAFLFQSGFIFIQGSVTCQTDIFNIVFVIFDEDLTSKLFSLGQVDSSELSLQSLLKSHTYM